MAQIPAMKQFITEAVELVFMPKATAKQLALMIALETGLVTFQQVSSLIQSLLSNFSSRSRLIGQLKTEQQNAVTQDDWMDLAERIDNIQGNDVWRSDPNCPLYERDRISARIDEFVHLMRRQDIFELMFVLRGSIGRNKFGLLHEALFTKALAGSKVLVETYHNVVCAALDFVCDAPVLAGEDPIPTDARLAFFNETRHSYGRTALLLSGGAALGFYHVGVVKTLMENNLMPRVIGGSSAGSILCAMIGTRTDEECVNDLFEVRGTDSPGHSGVLRLNFFRPLPVGGGSIDSSSALSIPVPDAITKSAVTRTWTEVYNNTAGAFHDAKRTLQGFVPIPLRHLSSFMYDIVTGNRRASDVFKNDTDHFRACVRANVGNFTFQEAFDRTGRILNIVVTPLNSSDPPRLLNYLTAPHVMVWSAAVASSSLPGVFEANRLVVKEADGWERYESGGGLGGQQFSDGSMEQDLPMQQLSEMFNVNHFIVSQANPHAVMFATYNQRTSIWSNPITGVLSSILAFLKAQLRTWLSQVVDTLGARRIAPFFDTQRGVGTQFFTQEYEGRPQDISLIPWKSHLSLMGALLHIIYNPSEAEFREWIMAAQRETWRYIPAIKSHIAEEITLDRCVQRLRTRLVHESWEKHSRGVGAAPGTEQTMGDRVPSFFTSPSLVNLGGLTISDQPNIEGLHQYTVAHAPQDQPESKDLVPPLVPSTDINSGWGGMGLRGNRTSSGNLQRTASDASGLFIDDEEHFVTQQDPGERTTAVENLPAKKRTSSSGSLQRAKHHDSDNSLGAPAGSYVKTSSMAQFYYRRKGSNNTLLTRTASDPVIDQDSPDQRPKTHARRKSRSHADLGGDWTDA